MANGPIFDSKGDQIGYTDGHVVFDLHGKKLYSLEGANLVDTKTGEVVGHLMAGAEFLPSQGNAADHLFPKGSR